MNKSVIAVAVCTLLALVAATVWVPVEAGGLSSHAPAWMALAGRAPRWPAYTAEIGYDIGPGDIGKDLSTVWVSIRWGAWGARMAVILSVGGLLALALHTRAKRRKAAAVRPSEG